ncbi:sensor histidine kinase KdpD [Flavobacterium sp. J27]|uniref:sensor histidine kinase n=1 Tax=Flavobacterium sp. J27 TaxID=2060419 RepID=UPI001031EE37|nr:HAMP domain-containing sensor histidine kinase [Flavobacterium sp. J27]
MNINVKKIFLFISIVILSTICLQVYWNYKNYITNKNRLFNEIQIAYDKALEIYFTEQSKKDVISFFSTDKDLKSKDFINLVLKDSLFKNEIRMNSPKRRETDSLFLESFSDDNVKIDTKIFFADTKQDSHPKNKSIRVLKGMTAQKQIGGLEQFPNRIVINMSSDTIRYKSVDSIFKSELNRKKIGLDYGFEHRKKDSLFYYFSTNKEIFSEKITPKSSFFKPDETLQLDFKYSNLQLFQRMGMELVLSFIFLLAVIGCLFFMLYIINKQKKMDEIKNDFINNITHEFKTPITTIATALEGMSNFNPTNDLEKNKKYISISKNQLIKLESMVEKILETAILPTEDLNVSYEEIDFIPLLNGIIEKYKTITNKELSFITTENKVYFLGDPFYLENVFSNLIDNAIKYGGDTITIKCIKEHNNIIIDVEDNGNGIPKAEEKTIFEKFYRIPTGNLHDVKGYGIGLYYSKEIIHKHSGTLALISTNPTIFRITLPYGY